MILFDERGIIMKILNAKRVVASCLTAAVMTAALSVPALAVSIDIPAINVSDTVQVQINESNPYSVFEFTPSESGTYHFFSQGDYDTVGSIYDSEEALFADISYGSNDHAIAYNDDYVEEEGDYNFWI